MRGFQRLLLCVSLVAVASAAGQRAFDVASVKLVPDPKSWIGPTIRTPQRFEALTILSQLIKFAYDVREDYQVVGYPAWYDRERYRIEATTDQPASEQQFREMVKALLADRFHLRAHRESKEMQVYALLVAKSGPRLVKAEPCGDRGCFNVGPGVFIGRGGTLAAFASILAPNLDYPVIDKTGISGHYDFNLTYDATGQASGPSIFAAIQDLGLRLEKQRAPIERIVVDAVDRPMEN